MHPPLFFASHSLETLAKNLLLELEIEDSLFSPPLIVISHPAMKEWLQLQLCKGKYKCAMGLEFVSWREALQRLGGLFSIPSRLELSMALWNKQKERATPQLTEFFAQGVDGFTLAPSQERDLFEEILSAHGWTTYPEVLKKIVPLRRRVYLFAIDFLPPAIHRFFLQLPECRMYKFSPCAMYWEDFRSAGEKKRILRALEKKNIPLSQVQSLDTLLRDCQPLLANWGMIGRKMLTETEAETSYEWQGEETLLNALKCDLLFFEKPEVFLKDGSIQCVKTGASRFHEIEWLQEEMIRLANSGIPFSAMRVYAPDIAPYAPIIQFTFDKVPYRIADLDFAQQSGFTQAILQMFRCVHGRWEAHFIIELFQRPAFMRKRGWQPEQMARIAEWIEMGAVRWGIDSLHKQETTDVKGANSLKGSWEMGWDEMLDSLLYLRPEKESQIGWGELELFEGFLETFNHLQKILLSWREEKTLATWAEEIDTLIQWALYSDETAEEDRAALNAVHKFVQGLRKASRAFPEETFPFTWIETHFSTAGGEIGGSQLHAVRFASLNPGSLVEARVIFCIGMDEESYPRPQVRSLFQTALNDLPLPSDFDRYLFLQTLFCAKERLIFSYGGSSKEDGKPVSPSLLLQELISYLGVDLVRQAERKIPPIQEKSLIHNSEEVPQPAETIAPMRELQRFYQHPPEYYLKQVLGLELKRELPSLWDEFTLSSLDRHRLLQSSLQNPLNLNENMPLGMFGEVAKDHLLEDAADYQESLQEWGIDPASIDTSQAVPGGVLHMGADDIGGLFRKWPTLLSILATNNTNQIFCLRTGKVRIVDNPKLALEAARRFFSRCRTSFCFLHAEWADAVLRKNSAPSLEQTKDQVLRWLMARSPAFDLEREMGLWRETFREDLASLIALFPVRQQTS